MAEESLELGCVWAVLESLRLQSMTVVIARVENNNLIFYPVARKTRSFDGGR
jgi:hypothetical protein